MTYKT